MTLNSATEFDGRGESKKGWQIGTLRLVQTAENYQDLVKVCCSQAGV